MKSKTCFVIGPIDEAGTERRRAADWLLKGIIKPVLETDSFGYVVQRADEIADPGSITDQIITSVMEADLVVADLTAHNPNAFYELAIRHMVEKPVVHMIMKGQAIPFDTKDYRTIIYDIAGYEDIQRAKQALSEQVEAIGNPGYTASNPITKARGHRKLAESSDSSDQLISRLMDVVERMSYRLEKVESSPAFLSPYNKLAQALVGGQGVAMLNDAGVPRSLLWSIGHPDKNGDLEAP